MANASKKVKYHALERLDKIDIEAQQDYAHNAADNYAGGLIGRTGLLDRPTTITVDNDTETISISDCSWLGWQLNHEGLGGARYSSFYGAYRAVDSRNGDISFDSVRAQVQSYYNTNGSLPPTPLSGAEYVPATHGFAYPYVYAITYLVDAEVEPRRFWSTADAAETTDNVATEIQQYHTFALVPYEDAAPAAGDFPPTKILRIAAWQVNNGVVDLYTVIPYMLSDSLLDIYPYHVDSSGNPFGQVLDGGAPGLAGTVAWLKSRQNAIVDGGLHDLAGTEQGEFDHTIPRFSLHGLEKYLGDRITFLEQKVRRAALIVKSRVNKITGTNEVTTHAWNDNDFFVGAYRDYSLLLGNASTGGIVYSPGVQLSDIANIADLERMAGAIFLSIPNQYAGYGLQVNLSTVFPTDEYTWLDEGDANGGSMVSAVNKNNFDGQWVLNPGIGHIADGNVSTWANRLNTVHPGWALMQDGSTRALNDQYGISIAHPSAYNSTTGVDHASAPINDNDAYITYYVKVDITLIRP